MQGSHSRMPWHGTSPIVKLGVDELVELDPPGDDVAAVLAGSQWGAK